MKLQLHCNKCLLDEISSIPLFTNFYEVEIIQEGIYRLICEKGHETIIELNIEHFEMLFDLGLMALLDGYTRESVASFASSLERMYEFCIRLLLEKNNIKYEDTESTWKNVTKSSERQLGAFYFMYLSEFKKKPPIISNKSVEFRNKVIHQGYIPTVDESVKYGEKVYTYMITVLKELRKIENFYNFHQNIKFRNRENYFKKHNKNQEIIGGYSYPTSFSWNVLYNPESNWGIKSFDECLESIKSFRNVIFAK